MRSYRSSSTFVTVDLFLARLHFSAEKLLLYPRRQRQRRCPHANVKVLEFTCKSFCIFSCILTLLLIPIKPLKTKAYDRRASGDCGTSGFISYCPLFKILSVTQVFRTFLGYAFTYIWMKVGVKILYEELENIAKKSPENWCDGQIFEQRAFIQNSVRHTSFTDFSWLCFYISRWKLVASFYMKSYRSKSTFVTVDLLFLEL